MQATAATIIDVFLLLTENSNLVVGVPPQVGGPALVDLTSKSPIFAQARTVPKIIAISIQALTSRIALSDFFCVKIIDNPDTAMLSLRPSRHAVATYTKAQAKKKALSALGIEFVFMDEV